MRPDGTFLLPLQPHCSRFSLDVESRGIHGTRIFTYIWMISMVNVGKYTIHGFYGNVVKSTHCNTPFTSFDASLYPFWTVANSIFDRIHGTIVHPLTWMMNDIKINQKKLGKYTSQMNPMGFRMNWANSCYLRIQKPSRKFGMDSDGRKNPIPYIQVTGIFFFRGHP